MFFENVNVDRCKVICRDGVLVIIVFKVSILDFYVFRFMDILVV